MLLLIHFRWLVSGFLVKHSIYRKLATEKYIVIIYSLAVIYNLLTFGDYYGFGEKYLNTHQAFFYDYLEEVKRALTVIELIILSVLTYQTYKVVQQLRQKGLID